jgi:hypothetical protein
MGKPWALMMRTNGTHELLIGTPAVEAWNKAARRRTAKTIGYEDINVAELQDRRVGLLMYITPWRSETPAESAT